MARWVSPKRSASSAALVAVGGVGCGGRSVGWLRRRSVLLSGRMALHPRGGGRDRRGIDERQMMGAAFDEAEHAELVEAAADSAGMRVQRVERIGGEEVGHAPGDEEAELHG